MSVARPEAVLARCREAGALELAEPLVQRDATESDVAEILQRFAATRESLAALRFADADVREMASVLALHMTSEQVRAHLAAIAARLGRAHVEATLPKPEDADPYHRPVGRQNGGNHHAQE